jgi:hypothetical protein
LKLDLKNIFLKYKGFILFLLLFLIYLKPLINKDIEHIFTGDSLLKMLQTDSVLKNRFLSDELYYEFKELDPKYSFYLMRGFTFSHNGLQFSQYPSLFAFLNAYPLYLFGPKSLFLGTFFSTFLFIYILIRTHSFHWITVTFICFGTPLILYGYEYSENILFLLLSFFAYSVTFKRQRFKKPIIQVLISFLLVLSMHFRLESMVFMAVFFPLYFLFYYKNRSTKFLYLVRRFYPLTISFLVFVLVFFFINQVLYGHPFGARFVVSGGNQFNLIIKLKQMFVLFFFGLGKIGFYGYMPIFLFLLFYYFKLFLQGNLSFQLNVCYSVLFVFIPVMSFTTGSESFVNWGPRYLALGIYPGIILLNHFVVTFLTSKKSYKILIVFFFIYSTFITWKGVSIQTNSYKMIKKIYLTFFKEESAELYLIDSELIAGGAGYDFIRKKILVIENFSKFMEVSDKILNKFPNQKIIYISSSLKKGDMEFPDKDKNPINSSLDWVTTRKFKGFKTSMDEIEFHRNYFTEELKFKYFREEEGFKVYGLNYSSP